MNTVTKRELRRRKLGSADCPHLSEHDKTLLNGPAFLACERCLSLARMWAVDTGLLRPVERWEARYQTTVNGVKNVWVKRHFKSPQKACNWLLNVLPPESRRAAAIAAFLAGGPISRDMATPRQVMVYLPDSGDDADGVLLNAVAQRAGLRGVQTQAAP